MLQYHDLLQTILDSGNNRGDRTGTGTRSCFGLQFRHDLGSGFPLLTTKKLSFKNIVVELIWFLRGDTNIKFLLENGCHIWTDDAYRMYKRKMGDIYLEKEAFECEILASPAYAEEHGDLGPVYGRQWREWQYKEYQGAGQYTTEYIDQIQNVIDGIIKNPEGRRHIVTAWNPVEIDRMALPPCHCLFQFYVHDGRLSCHLYQRSADVFLGVPYNIASYALLTHIIADQTGLGVGELVISFGDVHIYNNHLDQVEEQLSRKPKELPELLMHKGMMLKDYKPEYFQLLDYDPHPAIKADLSVGV